MAPPKPADQRESRPIQSRPDSAACVPLPGGAPRYGSRPHDDNAIIKLCAAWASSGVSVCRIGVSLMALKSAIEWTNNTWNPVTGCTKISAGCDHCYAEPRTDPRTSGCGVSIENAAALTDPPATSQTDLRLGALRFLRAPDWTARRGGSGRYSLGNRRRRKRTRNLSRAG